MYACTCRIVSSGHYSPRDDNMNTGFRETTVDQKSFVGTNAIEVTFNSTQITAWPGEKTYIVLEPRDELDNPAGALVHFTLYSFILKVCYY